MYLNFRIFIIIIIITTACGKKADTGKFNSEKWKSDRYACKDLRRHLLPDLEKVKPDLLGVSSAEALRVFGKPEATTLADQAERVHLYYLAPGPQCQSTQSIAEGNKLLIRINGLGLVSEISFEQPL